MTRLAARNPGLGGWLGTVLAASALLWPGMSGAGERIVARDSNGKRQFVLEQGMSGNYIVRDAKGQRIGTGYKRQDGSIALFGKDQRKMGRIEVHR